MQKMVEEYNRLKHHFMPVASILQDKDGKEYIDFEFPCHFYPFTLVKIYTKTKTLEEFIQQRKYDGNKVWFKKPLSSKK